MTYFMWVWQVISSNFQCFPWCCHPCGAIESRLQQGMGTKGTPGSAAVGLWWGCARALCPAVLSAGLWVCWCQQQQMQRQRSRQAPWGNKEGWSWPLALCQQSCAVWHWKEGIWHRHMTKWPQFHSALPSAEPNRSGHKKHSLCHEAHPVLWTKFVTANKLRRSGGWWCDPVKLVGMVFAECFRPASVRVSSLVLLLQA